MGSGVLSKSAAGTATDLAVQTESLHRADGLPGTLETSFEFISSDDFIQACDMPVSHGYSSFSSSYPCNGFSFSTPPGPANHDYAACGPVEVETRRELSSFTCGSLDPQGERVSEQETQECGEIKKVGDDFQE